MRREALAGRGRSRVAPLAATAVLVATLMGCADPGPDALGESPAPAPAAQPANLAAANLESAPLRIEVLSLAREGDGLLGLELALVNTSTTETVRLDDTFAPAAEDRDSIAGVSLLDESGTKRCFILRDEAGLPRCTRDIAPITAGERRVVSARFPAPAEDVEHVTVEVPGLPPFRNLPIAAAPGTGRQHPTY